MPKPITDYSCTLVNGTAVPVNAVWNSGQTQLQYIRSGSNMFIEARGKRQFCHNTFFNLFSSIGCIASDNSVVAAGGVGRMVGNFWYYCERSSSNITQASLVKINCKF